MRLLRRHWVIIALTLFIGVLGSYLMGQKTERKEVVTASKETILNRVKETQTLRCAYWLWPELVERDPNTGKMSGAYVEIIEQAAKYLNAKVLWDQEANIENAVSLIDTGKVDAICGPLVPGPNFRASAGFVDPVLYTSYDVYVNVEETRFKKSVEDLNKKSVQLLSLDGTASGQFSMSSFPDATQKNLPAVLGAGQPLLDIKDKKADATVCDLLTAGRFMDNNPNKIKQLRWGGKPLVTMGVTPFVVKVDALLWRDVLNKIIQDMVALGDVDRILTKYKMIAGKHYFPVAEPYRYK